MNLPTYNILKCEHKTYEPSRFPHESTFNTNLPVCINHAFLTPLQISLLIIHASISQTKTVTTQHTKSNTNTHFHCTIAWHSISATRQRCSADLLVVSNHRQAAPTLGSSLVTLSSGSPFRITKCYTSSLISFWFFFLLYHMFSHLRHSRHTSKIYKIGPLSLTQPNSRYHTVDASIPYIFTNLNHAILI